MATSPQKRGEIDNLLFLLSHRIRRALLPQFAGGPTSPSRARQAVGESLSLATYHTNVLYADGHGLLRKVAQRKVRGATETFFELKPESERTTLKAGQHSPHVAAQLRVIEALIKSIVSDPEAAARTGSSNGVGDRDSR